MPYLTSPQCLMRLYSGMMASGMTLCCALQPFVQTRILGVAELQRPGKGVATELPVVASAPANCLTVAARLAKSNASRCVGSEIKRKDHRLSVPTVLNWTSTMFRLPKRTWATLLLRDC